MTTTIGDYDRDEENAAIISNPPAAVGNPGNSTVGDDLEDLFKESDTDRYVTFKAIAPNGAEMALEFDTYLDPEEWARYQEIARGNRAARRSKNADAQAQSNLWKSGAAMLAEKSTKITNITTGRVYTDKDGENLTLRSLEWLEMAKAPRDPIAAALKFFKFAQIVVISSGYIEATGLDAEAERVDPTSA